MGTTAAIRPPANGGFDVLLVEDDDVVRLVMERALTKVPSVRHVNTARDGYEAMQELKSGDFDVDKLVIVLDLDLPRLPGLSFLKLLRDDAKLGGTPVVVLTGSTDNADRIEAFRLHAAGFMHKPTSVESLAELMHALDAYWSRVEFP